jgi:hypothetical protein
MNSTKLYWYLLKKRIKVVDILAMMKHFLQQYTSKHWIITKFRLYGIIINSYSQSYPYSLSPKINSKNLHALVDFLEIIPLIYIQFLFAVHNMYTLLKIHMRRIAWFFHLYGNLLLLSVIYESEYVGKPLFIIDE